MPEALVMCALAVAATERCRVGTGVLQLPLRSATAVAKAAATLHVASAGRFVLGVGAGEHRLEFDACGEDFARRGARLDEGIETLRSLWRGGESAYSQRPVVDSVPVWVGGRSAAAIERVVRDGDGWMPIFVTEESFRQGQRRLDDGLAAAGREPGEVSRSAVVIAAVTDSRWTRERALGWAGELWGLEPERFGRYLISGSASECAAALARYGEAGAEEVTVLLACDDPVAMFPALLEQWPGAARVGPVALGA